jgi:hypothetical protein
MEKKAPQSFNANEIQLSNVQIGIAGKNLSQNQHIVKKELEKQLSTTEVLEIVMQVEILLRSSNLDEKQKQKILKHLDSVKEEAKDEEPDKDFAAKSLQRATKVLKSASETVDAGSGLWERIQAIVTKLIPWLGVSKNFFGF